MRPRVWLILASLSLSLATHAQPLDGVIDLTVARADLVVRGKVFQNARNPVLIEVIETFKGPVMTFVSLDRTPLLSYRPLNQGTEVLVFAMNVDTRARTADAFAHPVDLVAVPNNALDISLRTLTTRAELLAAVANAGRAYPGPGDRAPPVIDLHPICPIFKDARTESALVAVARSLNADFVRRIMAIYALSHFDSDTARATLRALLADTTVVPMAGESKWQRGPYAIRGWAADLLKGPLKGMRIESSGNSEQGPALQYRPFPTVRGWIFGVVLAAVAVVLIAYRIVIGRSSRPPLATAWKLIALVSLVLAILLGALYRRSYSTTDELLLRLGPSHHELASRRGHLIYTLVGDWSPPANPKADDWQHSRRLHVGRFGPGTPDYWTPNAKPSFSRLGYSLTTGTISGPFGGRHPYHTFRLPLWLPLALSLLLPASHVLTLLHRHRRRRTQRCPICGYDLRASPGRCPECGHGAASPV